MVRSAKAFGFGGLKCQTFCGLIFGKFDTAFGRMMMMVMGDYLNQWVDEEEEPTAMVEENHKKKKTSDVIIYSFKFSFLILCTFFAVSDF